MPHSHPVWRNRDATGPVADHDETGPVEWHGLIAKLPYQIHLCVSKRGALLLTVRDIMIEAG